MTPNDDQRPLDVPFGSATPAVSRNRLEIVMASLVDSPPFPNPEEAGLLPASGSAWSESLGSRLFVFETPTCTKLYAERFVV